MKILKDESGQGAAEYTLLFGGVIVLAIAALYVYYVYIGETVPNISASGDINTVRGTIK